MQKLIMLWLCLILVGQNHAFAQALHWLSQPESALGEVQNGDTFLVKSSANGRFISFFSRASNIVSGDVNQNDDVFAYDLNNQTAQLVTVPSNGQQYNRYFLFSSSAPTSDGQWVAFTGTGNYIAGVSGFNQHLFLKNLQTGQLQLISIDDNSDSFEVKDDLYLADDGSQIVFITTEQLDPLHNISRANLYSKDLNTDNYTLLSVAEDNSSAANQSIDRFAVSANGRYIVMSSRATNLLSSTEAASNLFLLDTVTSELQLVTVKPDGLPSAYDLTFGISNLAVSNLGQVAYTAYHDDLVSGDNNGKADLFLFDGISNTRINLDNNGNELVNPSTHSVLLSANGVRLVFTSINPLLTTDTNNLSDVYSYDVQSATMNLITQGVNINNSSQYPQSYSDALSADGTRLFITSDLNLSGTQNFSEHAMVFMYDFNNQQMEHINPIAFEPNTITSRVISPQSSSDQMTVIYSSEARNLTTELENNISMDLFLLNREIDKHQKIATNITQTSHSISPSGRYVVFSSQFFQPAGEVNLGEINVFILDRNTNQYSQIAAGFGPSVNDAGLVVFSSTSNLTFNDNNTFSDVYLYNPDNASFSLISENTTGEAGNESSFDAKISGSVNDTWVVFNSQASDLISVDLNQTYDIFLRSWPAGPTIRVSQTPTLDGGNDLSTNPEISYNGELITFLSLSTNLTNDSYSGNSFNFEGFLYNRSNQIIELFARNSNGDPLDDGVTSARISDSGRYIAFSTSDSLLNEDNDTSSDIYLHDNVLGSKRLISKKTNNQQSNDNFDITKIVEDLTASPELVGITFTGQADLTDVAEHPGYNEAFLYQQGGPNVELTIQVIGFGSVNGSQSISCISNCDYNYPLGTELSLIGSADVGSLFDRWESSRGQCTDNSNPCNLTMNRDKQIKAIFIDENDIIFKHGFE